MYALFNSILDSISRPRGDSLRGGRGGIIALYLSGLNLSVSAAIGFVSLFGISVMDSILVITYFNQLIHIGQNTRDAMYSAAETRMRPMLMTALSACIGLLPAAFATGIGSQVQRPLAMVVVGGMLLGPVVLLVVMPALRMLVIDLTLRVTGKTSVDPEAR